jgi:biotin-dependent carboxylase-like uncharacterized protein
MTIHVESPGLFTTVQDLGRFGYGPIGVSASGACDAVALRIGNRLVGNPETAAALEMTLQGGRFLFPEGAVIALTGSDFTCDLPLWTTHHLNPGETLSVGRTRGGARGYLCVRGGVAVPRVLGSASTHILTGLGGHEGRALRKGDILPIGPEPDLLPKQSVREPVRYSTTLRVTDGPQAAWFPALCGAPYTVTPDANRMGIRLQGAPLALPVSGSMITAGVSLGCIQVPAGGQPLILFVEQQTTGGYPIAANIIAADLCSAGQLKPGDPVQFQKVDVREARELLYMQRRFIESERSYNA